jgi:uncharacterized membrane protein YGL010W
MDPRLVTWFEQYADSHRHPVNRLTHKVAIPAIVFHVLAMLDWVRFGALSLGHLAAVAGVIWYARLSPRLAAYMAVGFAACLALARVTPVPVVIAVAVVGWTVQLAGHVVWEKRSPAFLQNALQTLIGPLFFLALLTGDWPRRPAPV